MEVRRRSLSSEYEFRERRTSGKKKALPLAMVLSFNDKDIHPDCPNISNPYHKCGRHCLDKIPIGQDFLDAIRSGGDQEWEKKSEKRGVNPNCPLASNPYHKCAEYCLQNSSEKRQDAGKDQPEKPKGPPKKTNKDKVHLNRNASSLNKVEYVFVDTPKTEQLKGDMKSKKENEIDLTTQRELSSLCKNASEPYHVCDEYCFQGVPERERHGQVIKLKSSTEGEKVMSNIESTAAKPKEESEIIETVEQIVNLEYKNASNPSDVCPEDCFESVPEREQREQVIRLKSTKEGHRFLNNRHTTGFNPWCKHASKPHHECTEFCFKNTLDRSLTEEAVKNLKDEETAVLSSERRVNPECKFASNPYHACSEYCFPNVLEGKQQGQEKPKGTHKKMNKDKVHLNRSASGLNKVIKYVFEDIPKKEHLKGDMKSKKENEIDLTTQRELSSLCKNASKSYHVCDEYCFQSVSEKDPYGQVPKSKEESEIIETVEQIVNLEYKNASNPSVVSLEYCFESLPEREQHEQIIRLQSTREEDKFLNNIHKTGFDRCCKHASKPHHECTELCFKNTPDGNLDEEAIKPKEESKIVVVAEQGVNLEHRSASNPDYVPAENGFQSVPEREQHRLKKMKGVSFKIEKNSSLPDNKHISNPYHGVNEGCFDDNTEQEHPNGVMKPKEERIVFTAERGVDLLCKYASNPYHECIEYCFQNLPNEDQRGKALKKSKEKEAAVVPLERVNPQCKHASNPYHVCAEYCFQSVSNGHHPGQPMVKSKEEKKVIPSPQVVNLDCKYTSNPYHVCAEYCFENVLERDPPKQTIKKLTEEDTEVLSSERSVNPDCKFASNPYHACSKYCFQNPLDGERQGRVVKQKSLKELKNLVSNKKIASGNPHCEYSSNPYHQCAEYCFNKNVPGGKIPDGVMKTYDRKKENQHALSRDDNTKYKSASNSFNRRSENSPEEISPKSEGVEGSTATIKKKNRNSAKGNKRNHPIVEKKISLNSKYMDASKPGQNYVESSERIILQDGTEKKGSMSSKYAETFSPTNNNFNLKNGISMHMQYETKDMQSDIKIPKEATDVPSLNVNASDLFHEWTKYCSQTRVADEDEMVKKQENKVGIGEVSTRNGKGNGLLSSENIMEKVEATGGFSRSLSVLLLLFLLVGFLLALLH